MKREGNELWSGARALLHLEKDAGDKLHRQQTEASEPAALLEGLAHLVEGCAEQLGLDTYGILCRLTVILLADEPGGEGA